MMQHKEQKRYRKLLENIKIEIQDNLVKNIKKATKCDKYSSLDFMENFLRIVAGRFVDEALHATCELNRQGMLSYIKRIPSLTGCYVEISVLDKEGKVIASEMVSTLPAKELLSASDYKFLSDVTSTYFDILQHIDGFYVQFCYNHKFGKRITK